MESTPPVPESCIWENPVISLLSEAKPPCFSSGLLTSATAFAIPEDCQWLYAGEDKATDRREALHREIHDLRRQLEHSIDICKGTLPPAIVPIKGSTYLKTSKLSLVGRTGVCSTANTPRNARTRNATELKSIIAALESSILQKRHTKDHSRKKGNPRICKASKIQRPKTANPSPDPSIVEWELVNTLHGSTPHGTWRISTSFLAHLTPFVYISLPTMIARFVLSWEAHTNLYAGWRGMDAGYLPNVWRNLDGNGNREHDGVGSKGEWDCFRAEEKEMQEGVQNWSRNFTTVVEGSLE